jgi:hypothetical protein
MIVSCKKMKKVQKNDIACFSFAQQRMEKVEVGLLCTIQALFNYGRYTDLVAVVEIPFFSLKAHCASLSLIDHH